MEPETQNTQECRKMSQKTAKKRRYRKKRAKIEGFEDYKFQGDQQVKARKKAVLAAIGDTLGHIGNACKQADISPRTHQRWKKEDPEYRRAYSDHCEYMVDEFEYLLKKRAYSSDTTAIIFFLKTKGKDRGYLETTKNINEHSGEITNPVGINFILQPDPKHDKEKEDRAKLSARKDQAGKEEVPKPEMSDKKETNDSP